MSFDTRKTICDTNANLSIERSNFIMSKSYHHWLSIPTRNACIVTKINKENATIDDIVSEFGDSWDSIVASLYDVHYHLLDKPDASNKEAWRIYRGNETRFNKLIATAKANTRAAQTAKTNVQRAIPRPTTKVPPVQPVQVTASTKSKAPAVHSTSVPSRTRPSVYLVETGYLLSVNFSDLLAMDDGNAVFMIPRFCINEMKRIAQNTADSSSMNKSEEVLLKLYSEYVWQKRFMPFESVETGFIAKTADVIGYKKRSFGIAEAALEIYISSDRSVHVLTSAMEVQHLVTRMVKSEGLESEIFVTRIYRN